MHLHNTIGTHEVLRSVLIYHSTIFAIAEVETPIVFIQQSSSHPSLVAGLWEEAPNAQNAHV
jgi:hypothetical protein